MQNKLVEHKLSNLVTLVDDEGNIFGFTLKESVEKYADQWEQLEQENIETMEHLQKLFN